MSDDGSFVVKNIIELSDLEQGQVSQLSESDITIQTNSKLIQFKHVDQKNKDKYVIKPGSFYMDEKMGSCTLKTMELRKYDLLESVNNTEKILKEVDKFFSKLDVYKQLSRDPKRAILLCSPPGVGKTSAINQVCNELLEQEGTCVIIWDTSEIDSSTVNRFFLKNSVFSEEVQRLILVMEDVSGGTVEDHYGAKGVDSSLLNLLDGVGNPFKSVPTFIISTTNNPERSVGALIDRPGRFDKVIELTTPTEQESVALLEFIANRKITEEEKKAAQMAALNKFSIAHLQEIVVRSMLDDISYLEVTQQLIEHKKRFKEGFQEVKTVRLGFGN